MVRGSRKDQTRPTASLLRQLKQLRQWTELEVEIGAAIKSGQILPYYQPLVDLRTGIVVGCEVLARWKHPTRGLLPPSAFIPLAIATGKISKLTYALLRRAAVDAQTWPDALSISLNLAAHMVGKQLPAGDPTRSGGNRLS